MLNRVVEINITFEIICAVYTINGTFFCNKRIIVSKIPYSDEKNHGTIIIFFIVNIYIFLFTNSSKECIIILKGVLYA